MDEVEVKVPEDYMLAAALFNKVLNKYMTRQLYYNSVVPIFERAGLAIKRGRYLYIKANPAEWEIYAKYRTEKVNSHEWIKRRPWSLEDLQLALSEAAEPELVPA